MNDNYQTIGTVTIERIPKTLYINLNAFGYGLCAEQIKDIQITIDQEVFIFTTQEIKDILHKLKGR